MTAPLVYRHRPKPFGSECVLTLAPDALLVEHGRRKGRFPYADIARLRLSYAPTNVASDGYRARIVTRSGRTATFGNLSWRSMAEMERHHAEYREFLAALGERIARGNPEAAGEAGLPRWRYRLIAAVGAASALALGAATLFGIWRRLRPDADWPAGLASLVAGMSAVTLAYLAWWLWRYLRHNRPQRFTLPALPEQVLPPAT